MGVLVKQDNKGNLHPREFGTVQEFHGALQDALEKIAGPRKDGKLSQLEYAAEKAASIETGVKTGIMSANAVVRQVRRMKVIFLDIARDLQYARRCSEELDGGVEKGQSVCNGHQAVGSGRSMVQVLSEGGRDAQV